MSEIAPFSEEKSCPRLCQVHLYREKLTVEVKVLILPLGIFLFPKNVEKAKIAGAPNGNFRKISVRQTI